MIRITSLDMPRNDYMRFVRKVIHDLNIKDEKEAGKINSPHAI
jgi:hypothetical protein